MIGRACARIVFALSIFFALALVPARAHAQAGEGLGKPSAPLDRSTPKRTITGFLSAAHASDFLKAAHYLDLRDTPRAEQSIRGPELARELAFVLDHEAPIDENHLSDDPIAEPPGTELVVTTLTLGDERVPISVVRVPAYRGGEMWVVSRSTVAVIPTLFASFGTEGWQARVPEALRHQVLGNAFWQWIGLFALIAIAYVFARIISFGFVAVARFFAKRSPTPVDDQLVAEVRPPLRILLFVLIFRQAVGFLDLSVVAQDVADFGTFTLLVIGLASLFLRVLGVAMGWAVGHLPRETQYELRRRELRTRFVLLRRIANVIVAVLATAVILTQFSFVRTVGLSVLASAGIAGVVVGLAAQKSVSSVIAGIQISFTQPIRIGDVVKVEGQTGTVEEVSLTNVVIRIADQRRLIVPVSRFLEQPFENWTRQSGEINGTVTLLVDFATPIEELRAEAKRLVEENPLWDKRACKIYVSDVSQSGVQVSVVVSASDSNRLDDLKNDVREKILAYLQAKEGGAYFITTRNATPAPPAQPQDATK